MIPTFPPTARCLWCRQRRLSTDLCPVCQMCAGCGCAGECDRVALEMELRQELEAALGQQLEVAGKEAEEGP